MRLSERLRRGVDMLRTAGIEGAERDARRLLAYTLGLDQSALILKQGAAFPEHAEAGFQAALKARASHQPVSQIIGERLFWGRRFKVTPDVLDPRPETECLIEHALKAPFSRVLDLGTGSGVILLTLLSENPQAHGIGVDISPAALKIAHENAANFTLHATWQESNWLKAVTGRFDLIVANPPYIPSNEYNALARTVRDWEPKIALCPGDDGVAAYRAILNDLGKHTLPGARVLFEIGPGQSQNVARLMSDAGLNPVTCLPDFDTRARVICGIAPNSIISQ